MPHLPVVTVGGFASAPSICLPQLHFPSTTFFANLNKINNFHNFPQQPPISLPPTIRFFYSHPIYLPIFMEVMEVMEVYDSRGVAGSTTHLGVVDVAESAPTRQNRIQRPHQPEPRKNRTTANRTQGMAYAERDATSTARLGEYGPRDPPRKTQIFIRGGDGGTYQYSTPPVACGGWGSPAGGVVAQARQGGASLSPLWE